MPLDSTLLSCLLMPQLLTRFHLFLGALFALLGARSSCANGLANWQGYANGARQTLILP